MRLKLITRRSIYILFALAVVLLLFNLLLDKFIVPGYRYRSEPTGSDLQVNERFLGIVQNFGIDDNFIKQKTRVPSHRSYIIYVPPDLPIPVILADIYAEFIEDSLQIRAMEVKKGSATNVIVSDENKILMESEFSYSKKYTRQKGTVSFLIDNFTLENKDDSLFLKTAGSFCLLLIPSKKNAGITKFINSNRKEFTVLLSDDIDELDFRLKESYSEQRLSNSIKSIVAKFGNAIFFIIDDNSQIYKSSSYNFINNELLKRKISVALLSSFKTIDYENEQDLTIKFDSEVMNLNPGEHRIFKMNKEDYLTLKPEIVKFRKIGVKFYSISNMIK